MAAQTGATLSLILVAHRAPDRVDVLRSLLEREGYMVLCAYNGRTAQHLIRQHHPVLLLLDQALPLVDGLDLCRTVRRASDSPAIFILSDHPDELNKLLAFNAGADDYLPLPIHPHELLGRVRVALRRMTRSVTSTQGIIRAGGIELDPEQRQARAAGHPLALTSLEYELLTIFVCQPGRVFSREDLLNRLGGFLRGMPFDRAVDIHVSNVRRKLRRAMGADVPIETVRGVGYRLRFDASDEAGPSEERAPAHGAGLEELALAALERAPVPLLVLSPERTVLLYNEAAQHLCGWRADEVAGQVACYSLLGCHSVDGTLLCHDMCPMRVGLHSGMIDQQARYVITLKDGRELPVAAQYSRLPDTEGQRDCVLLVLQPAGERAAGGE